jgi:hypothetical protein
MNAVKTLLVQVMEFVRLSRGRRSAGSLQSVRTTAVYYAR